MIDIVANVKIDESKPERIDYFLTCIKSLEFLKGTKAAFYFNLEQPSEYLRNATRDVLRKMGVNYMLMNLTEKTYGETYTNLLKLGDNPYVMNFIEDHFCMIDDAGIMAGLLNSMKDKSIDICKSSFFQIEQNSSKTLNLYDQDPYGKYFFNTELNHNEYQRYYGKRYYIGVNFITTRSFAEVFWNRSHITSNRPHPYEIGRYESKFLHNCMIPNIEILCAIDDDHGEKGTRLLDRANEKRFWDIYKYFSPPSIIKA